MAFQDGFYKVDFGTPLGQGAGVAHFSGGKVHGGDSMMAYVGKYSVSGDDVSAEVRVFTHRLAAADQRVRLRHFWFS